jgi:hypothetical protein
MYSSFDDNQSALAMIGEHVELGPGQLVLNVVVLLHDSWYHFGQVRSYSMWSIPIPWSRCDSLDPPHLEPARSTVDYRYGKDSPLVCVAPTMV